MNRRSFLQTASLFSLSLLVPGLKGWAYSSASDSANKKLLVIFLRGAVDGLNVVVPYADRHYYDLRPSIAIPPPSELAGVLDLDGHFGLHPALAPLMPIWKDGSIAFIHASGSPDSTRSHFDAQDYMETGVPGAKTVSTGWMNRLLTCLPDNKSPVRAVNLGPTIPRIFSGSQNVASVEVGRANKPMAMDNPQLLKPFEQMYAGRYDAISKAFNEGVEARQTITKELADEMNMANNGAVPPNAYANFGGQLAKLFNKDPQMQLAFLAFGGWDTHVNQGSSEGQLANHLRPLGTGLAEFVKGLGDLYKQVTIVVMSEFGRTAHENGNHGTDHGHGNVMWVLGGTVNGGKVFGHWDGLSDSKLHEGRDLPVSTDFRTVLSQVLHEQLKVSQAGLNKVFPDYISPAFNDLFKA